MKATSNKAIFSAPSGQIWGWGQKKLALFRGSLLFSLGVWLALFRGSLQIVGQHYSIWKIRGYPTFKVMPEWFTTRLATMVELLHFIPFQQHAKHQNPYGREANEAYFRTNPRHDGWRQYSKRLSSRQWLGSAPLPPKTSIPGKEDMDPGSKANHQRWLVVFGFGSLAVQKCCPNLKPADVFSSKTNKLPLRVSEFHGKAWRSSPESCSLQGGSPPVMWTLVYKSHWTI